MMRCLSLASVALLLTLVPASSGSPRDELLRFIPEDVGLCFVLTDMRGQYARLAESPFMEQLSRLPAVQAFLASEEIAKLRRTEKQLQAILGLDAAQLRDGILGDALVFAYRPGPADKPEGEQGLFLLHAPDPKMLANLIDRINKAQQQAGDLRELKERTHRGLTYFSRTDRKETSFYYLDGPILLVTSQEPMLQQALERKDRTEEPWLARRLDQVGADAALLSLWINPRAFDAHLAAKLADAPAKDATGLRAFSTYWSALEGLALYVRLDRDVSVSLAVQAASAKLPGSARRFLEVAAQPSAWWKGVPDAAILAFGFRFDLAALLDVLADFQTPEQRQTLHRNLNVGLGAALGKDFVADVVPFLGPEWGVCVAAPTGKELFPHALLALRVAPGDATAPVDQGLLSTLQAFATLAVTSHNMRFPDRPLTLKRAQQDRREVRYLHSEEVLPPGLQPAFALDQGYLLLASSPDALRRLLPPAVSPSEAAATVPLARMSFRNVQKYLQDKRDSLIQFQVEKQKQTQAQAEKELDRLIEALHFIDTLTLTCQPTSDQMILRLSLQPMRAFRK